MANFGPLTADIGSGVWDTTAMFNGFRVFASLLQLCRSPEANQTPNFAQCLAVSWAGTLYIFGGSCRLTEFCYLQNSLYVQILRCVLLYCHRYCPACTPAAGLNQTLRSATRNGITELSQRAPPIFGWAAITLGIGPHSSFFYRATQLC